MPQITRVTTTGPDAGADLTFNGVGSFRIPGPGGFVVAIVVQKDERILLVLNNNPFRLARVFK